MAHYRNVDVRIWNDEKFIDLSKDGKLAFLFLLTHPNQTMLGAMRVSVHGLAAELYAINSKTPSSGVLKGFDKAFQKAYREAFMESISKGMVRVDERANLVWLPNFLKYNPPQSPNVVKAWPRVFDLIPESQMKPLILARMKEYTKGLPQSFQKAFMEAFRKALPKSMPNQEQEQEQEQISQNLLPLAPQDGSKEAGSESFGLLMDNGKTWPLSDDQIKAFEKAYPAVDVRQELRAMAMWLVTNQKKRKTARGMPAFVNGWLQRSSRDHSEQDAKVARMKRAAGGITYDPAKPVKAALCDYCDERSNRIFSEGRQDKSGLFCSDDCEAKDVQEFSKCRRLGISRAEYRQQARAAKVGGKK